VQTLILCRTIIVPIKKCAFFFFTAYALKQRFLVDCTFRFALVPSYNVLSTGRHTHLRYLVNINALADQSEISKISASFTDITSIDPP